MTPTLVICAAGALVTGGLLAVPPAADGAETLPPVAGAPAAIRIAGVDFGAPRTVEAGADVPVSNADAEAHAITAENGAFDTGSVDGGTTVSFTAPTVPGTYEFFCAIHPTMTSQLVVD